MGAMHEVSLTACIVDSIRERLPDERVTRVRLRIGALIAVEPEALRFCFDVCTRGTLLEGAALEIEEVAARGRCRACGDEGDLDGGLPLCRCGSADLDLLAGGELRIREVEIA
jgi:hydrogenase nickel incorporation protein HypA/HybF